MSARNKVFVIVVFLGVALCIEKQILYEYKEDICFEQGASYIWTYNTETVIQCIMACDTDNRCLGAFYNTASSSSATCRGLLSCPDPDNDCDDPAENENWITYSECALQDLSLMSYDIISPLAPGGAPFNHSDLWNNSPITEIQMTCGELMNDIRVRYGCTWSSWNTDVNWPACGQSPDHTLSFKLQRQERITRVVVTHSNYIFSVVFVSNLRSSPVCGRRTGETTRTLQGQKLLYLSGKRGCHLDQLAFYWAT